MARISWCKRNRATLMQYVSESKTDAQIAELMGCTIVAVQVQMEKMRWSGVEFAPRRKAYDWDRLDPIVQGYRARGMSFSRIAQLVRININPESIRRRVMKMENAA